MSNLARHQLTQILMALKRGARIRPRSQIESSRPPSTGSSASSPAGQVDPRMVRVVDLRVFAGMNGEEVTHVLGISSPTVHGDWRVAKMWLARELSAGDAS